ncbi:hypothetical protein GW17_00059803, partial [Ensete ventricosum]
MLLSRPPPIPLNSTRTEIFLQIQERRLLKTLNPMKTRSKRRDKRRYCCFHREHGHDTKECRDFQSQIEDLIRQGHLYHYVCDQSSFPDGQPPRDPSPRPKGPVEKQIDVIIGGPTSSDDSSSARKAYACTELRENLDLLEERRAEAHLRTLAYKKAIVRLYDHKVHPRFIRTGDLVLRKAEV